VKAVDSHGHSLEPLFDVVSDSIIKPTAQIVTLEGSQIARSIDEKLCLGNIVFLSEPVQEPRRGVCPAAAEHVNLKQQL